MVKVLAASLTALILATYSLAYGQSVERPSAADQAKLADARIEIIKAALQLSPDQAQYWPAVEEAIRTRVQNRQSRIARIAETVGKASDQSVVELLQNRDPIAFLNRRSEALAQRSADLKKLADAWQPLYRSLNPEQKRRMALLGFIALRQVSNALERQIETDDDDEWVVMFQRD